MSDRMTVIHVLISCLAISSLGGLASLLRSGKEISFRTVLTSMLYSGLVGLVIGLFWYQYFSGRENLYFLIGVSGLAGLGGTTLLDFFVQVLSKGGINIHVAPKNPGESRRDEIWDTDDHNPRLDERKDD